MNKLNMLSLLILIISIHGPLCAMKGHLKKKYVAPLEQPAAAEQANKKQRNETSSSESVQEQSASLEDVRARLLSMTDAAQLKQEIDNLPSSLLRDDLLKLVLTQLKKQAQEAYDYDLAIHQLSILKNTVQQKLSELLHEKNRLEAALVRLTEGLKKIQPADASRSQQAEAEKQKQEQLTLQLKQALSELEALKSLLPNMQEEIFQLREAAKKKEEERSTAGAEDSVQHLQSQINGYKGQLQRQKNLYEKQISELKEQNESLHKALHGKK